MFLATIVANTVAGVTDCVNNSINSGVTTLNGVNNLIENNSSCPGASVTVDPQLGLLGDNGGDAQTHALLPGSPAIDAGSCDDTISDQRGFSRPVDLAAIPNTDDGCDIGAYEVGPQLTLSKMVTPTMPNPGNTITYIIVISNNSIAEATNALVSDTLPVGLDFVGPIVLNPEGAGIVGDLGTLPTLAYNLTITAGKQITLTFPVTVDTDLAGGQVITNTAAVTSVEVSISVIGEIPITIANNNEAYLPLILKQ
jgi:uncharacterized repeat protein (TIGR01451 family)